MLTQDQIYAPDGRNFPAKNKPIQIMDPTPGNGWGCISAVDLIRMVRKLAKDQGKTVTVVEVQARGGFKKTVAILALLFTAAIFSIGTILTLVK